MTNFYWVGLLFWTLLIGSIILFLIGVIKKSGIITLISSILYLPIGIYFYAAAENWMKAFLFFFIIPLIFTILYFKKASQSRH